MFVCKIRFQTKNIYTDRLTNIYIRLGKICNFKKVDHREQKETHISKKK